MGTRIIMMVAVAAAVALAPQANADPVVPGMQTNCESGFNGTVWCDGPVKPDGRWARCFSVAPSWTPQGAYVAGAQRCFAYDPANPPGLPLGQPNHHIGL